MKINTKIRYGLRTMIEIATANDGEGVLQRDIAKNQRISLKYLDPIIAALKLKGLITNKAGRGSGYILNRPINEITVFDIYTSFEPTTIVDCLHNLEFCDQTMNGCKSNSYWNEFKKDMIAVLKSKTLAQIIGID